MTEGRSNTKLPFALATALGVALLVIAFLVGRESVRNATGEAPGAESQLPPVPRVESRAQGETSAERDPWKVRDEDYAYADEHRGSAGEIDRRPDGTVVLSNTRNDEAAENDPGAPPSTTPQAARASSHGAVAEYFQQVDVIRSEAGAGDPNVFAMDMIKAGLGGATAGFDRLIADTDRMTREMKSVTPPPSCLSYHQATLQSLEEARGMLESMKGAITTRDMQSLSEIAQQAAALQAKAAALERMQEQIRASDP
jgi:hypothetical protein